LLRPDGRGWLWRPLLDTPRTQLRAYAAEGIGHVQLVIDPITEASVTALAPVLELLDRG
jgi:hypothetical protein